MVYLRAVQKPRVGIETVVRLRSKRIDGEMSLTPGSPSKFLMAAFVRVFAQKVTAEICPVQPFVMFKFCHTHQFLVCDTQPMLAIRLRLKSQAKHMQLLLGLKNKVRW